MGRLYCRCLNVIIHHTGKLEAGRIVPASQLLPDSIKDPLLSEQLLELELDLAGVTTQQKPLMQVRVAGDWQIHHCSNCSIDVYVSHVVKQGKVFLSTSLTSDPTQLLQDKDYSRIFKLILRPRGGDASLLAEQDTSGEFRQRLSSMTFSHEDPVMRLIHHQFKTSITLEREAMEERIREYEENQRKSFEELQKQAHREKSLLFAAVSKARESGIHEAINDSPHLLVKQTGKGTETTTGTSSNSSNSSNSNSSSKSSPENSLHRVTITLKDMPAMGQRRTVTDSNEDDGMFNFDEDLDLDTGADTVDFAPFPQSSDDDDTSTEDSSFRDESTIRNIAFSLPVNVPMFNKKKSTDEPAHKFEDDEMAPSDVARSIQQLALSVHDTGMFGDLPKPRVNSRR